MRVLYLDQAGNGLADEVDMADGATIEDFMLMKKGTSSFGDHEVSVNRRPAVEGQKLQNGDVISITPKKYGGAR